MLLDGVNYRFIAFIIILISTSYLCNCTKPKVRLLLNNVADFNDVVEPVYNTQEMDSTLEASSKNTMKITTQSSMSSMRITRLGDEESRTHHSRNTKRNKKHVQKPVIRKDKSAGEYSEFVDVNGRPKNRFDYVDDEMSDSVNRPSAAKTNLRYSPNYKRTFQAKVQAGFPKNDQRKFHLKKMPLVDYGWINNNPSRNRDLWPQSNFENDVAPKKVAVRRIGPKHLLLKLVKNDNAYIKPHLKWRKKRLPSRFSRTKRKRRSGGNGDLASLKNIIKFLNENKPPAEDYTLVPIVFGTLGDNIITKNHEEIVEAHKVNETATTAESKTEHHLKELNSTDSENVEHPTSIFNNHHHFTIPPLDLSNITLEGHEKWEGIATEGGDSNKELRVDVEITVLTTSSESALRETSEGVNKVGELFNQHVAHNESTLTGGAVMENKEHGIIMNKIEDNNIASATEIGSEPLIKPKCHPKHGSYSPDHETVENFTEGGDSKLPVEEIFIIIRNASETLAKPTKSADDIPSEFVVVEATPLSPENSESIEIARDELKFRLPNITNVMCYINPTTGSTTEAPITTGGTTEAPTTTEASTTETSTTEASTTEAPTTKASTTEASTTKASTTEASTTETPTTEASTTETSTMGTATTKALTTEASTTKAPTAEALTTEASTTGTPTIPATTMKVTTTTLNRSTIDTGLVAEAEDMTKELKDHIPELRKNFLEALEHEKQFEDHQGNHTTEKKRREAGGKVENPIRAGILIYPISKSKKPKKRSYNLRKREYNAITENGLKQIDLFEGYNENTASAGPAAEPELVQFIKRNDNSSEIKCINETQKLLDLLNSINNESSLNKNNNLDEKCAVTSNLSNSTKNDAKCLETSTPIPASSESDLSETKCWSEPTTGYGMCLPIETDLPTDLPDVSLSLDNNMEMSFPSAEDNGIELDNSGQLPLLNGNQYNGLMPDQFIVTTDSVDSILSTLDDQLETTEITTEFCRTEDNDLIEEEYHELASSQDASEDLVDATTFMEISDIISISSTVSDGSEEHIRQESQILEKINTLEKDLRLVNEVQSIINGINENSNSTKKSTEHVESTTVYQKRALLSEDWEEKSPFVRKVSALGKLLNWKYREPYEKNDRFKRFLIGRKIRKKKRFWPKSMEDRRFLDRDPQNFS